jgi:hypothetical protein
MPLEILVTILLIGAIGGYLSGVVGVGMGATVVPSLILLGVDPITAIGSSLLQDVLIAPLGGISHYKFGHIRRRIFVPLAVVGMLSAYLGANISTYLPAGSLKLLVGISAIAAGLLIIVKYPRARERKLTPTLIGKVLRVVSTSTVALIALIAGLSYGALGMGWGPLGISLLILARVSPHTAVGSSVFARSFVALAGASTYYFLVGIRADIALPLIVGGSIAVPFGALTAKRLSPRTLKLIIGVAVIMLGSSVLLKQVI